MRTIERQIVGGFIFSSDNKFLLGHNRIGGVNEGQLVVPGGGIEPGESELEALIREISEEVCMDISSAKITKVNLGSGESEKTLRSGERVYMKMDFHDYMIQISQDSTQVTPQTASDYEDAKWYTAAELKEENIGSATRKTLEKIGYL